MVYKMQIDASGPRRALARARRLIERQGIPCSVDQMDVRVRGTLDEGVAVAVLSALQQCGSELRIWPVMRWTEYEPKDLEEASLVEVSIQDVDFTFPHKPSTVCPGCGRKSHESGYFPPLEHIASKQRVMGSVEYHVIVSKEVRREIARRRFVGAAFLPCDQEGRYEYLWSRASLGRLVIEASEHRDYGGVCSTCGRDIFGQFFGPLRYRRSAWCGEDVILGDIAGAPVYSQRMATLLRAFDRRVKAVAPVVLV